MPPPSPSLHQATTIPPQTPTGKNRSRGHSPGLGEKGSPAKKSRTTPRLATLQHRAVQRITRPAIWPLPVSSAMLHLFPEIPLASLDLFLPERVGRRSCVRDHAPFSSPPPGGAADPRQRAVRIRPPYLAGFAKSIWTAFSKASLNSSGRFIIRKWSAPFRTMAS